MPTEIERDDWTTFFDSFTVAHGHWPVHVDGERESLPLETIVARDGKIVIHLGTGIEHHRTITIEAASVVHERSVGTGEDLAITSRDGHTTRLRFRAPRGA